LSHGRHSRRRRIADPSSSERESTTRDSSCRQNGQCMVGKKPLYGIGLTEIVVLHIVAIQPTLLLHIVTVTHLGKHKHTVIPSYSKQAGPSSTFRSPKSAGFGATLYCGPTRIISIVRFPTSLILTSVVPE